MYEIIIGKAIGSIKIGMKREEVQNLFNDLNEWRETPFGYDHEVVYDNNDEFQICYDENNCVNFILCNAEDSLPLNGKVLNDELFYEDILEIAKESASDVEEDEVGFTSNQLGFGACAYYDDGSSPFLCVNSFRQSIARYATKSFRCSAAITCSFGQ